MGPGADMSCGQGHKSCNEHMPTIAGWLEGQPVTVLRDSGCDTVVLRRLFVRDSKLTGRIRTIRLLDGSVRRLPEAKVGIDCPFFKGTIHAACMESPLYDVILGNVSGVRPDTNWVTANQTAIGEAATTLQTQTFPFDASSESSSLGGVTQLTSKMRPLPVRSVNPRDLNPEALSSAQKEDPTLSNCFAAIGTKTIRRSDVTEFVLKNGILFRRYQLPTRKEVEQLVVPKDLRPYVLKMAHEGILAGH